MNASYLKYWRGLATGSRRSPFDTLILMLLIPWAGLYGSAQRLRARMYKSGILKTGRLPRPVISIGNITVGGTGKTPVTAHIARILLARGCRVAVLSRGYGGSLEGQTCVVSDGATIMLGAAECGDEPYLLAATVPGLMVVIGPDRYAAGRTAMQQLVPDIFLLDDGFQHLSLHRDLNILLMDFSRPLGNGWTLPAGILREPPAAAGRADLVILTRASEGAINSRDTGGIPHCLSRHTIVDLLPLGSISPVPFSRCSGHTLLAFAGIADPESFFTGLRREGLNLVQTLSFPDHIVYDRERCREIAEAMRASGADFMITTEKDGVKLKGFSQEQTARTLLARLELTVDNPELLNGLLDTLLRRHEA